MQLALKKRDLKQKKKDLKETQLVAVTNIFCFYALSKHIATSLKEDYQACTLGPIS